MKQLTQIRGSPRNLDKAVPQQLQLKQALNQALDFLANSQHASGYWAGAYGGPMFLLPAYVMVQRALGRALPPADRHGMRRYIEAQQHSDGGFGLSHSAPATVFTTVLNATALRLLGAHANDHAVQAAYRWLAERGGPTSAAPWGKYFLALLGLYDYSGLPPTPPELWLLPRSLPVHPARFWCHTRMVYLPLSWLYGQRASCAPDRELLTLRDELYNGAYNQCDWVQHLFSLAPDDSFAPPSAVFKRVSFWLAAYEQRPLLPLRQRALTFVAKQIAYEDRNTNYICLGPINKLLHVAVYGFSGKQKQLNQHLRTLEHYLQRDNGYVYVNGYQSSRLWDTAFAARVLALSPEHQVQKSRANTFIRNQQIKTNPPVRRQAFRDKTVGGWPFSQANQGWPTSDCTAEALLACFDLEAQTRALSKQRIVAAVDFMLAMQNSDGGWPAYERARGPAWLERLNPASVFGKIMIDYSYPECTSACLQALASAKPRLDRAHQRRLQQAMRGGRDYLLKTQLPDGSWFGSWGICFTYGTYWGVLGLLAAGLPAGHLAIDRAVEFLIRWQLPDGGWGETLQSCRQQSYHSTSQGQAVMTAWALLALIAAGRSQTTSVQRGIHFLLERQQANGCWPSETIAGVFNQTCAIHYDNYLKIFPTWALAAYNRQLQAKGQIYALTT